MRREQIRLFRKWEQDHAWVQPWVRELDTFHPRNKILPVLFRNKDLLFYVEAEIQREKSTFNSFKTVKIYQGEAVKGLVEAFIKPILSEKSSKAKKSLSALFESGHFKNIFSNIFNENYKKILLADKEDIVYLCNTLLQAPTSQPEKRWEDFEKALKNQDMEALLPWLLAVDHHNEHKAFSEDALAGGNNANFIEKNSLSESEKRDLQSNPDYFSKRFTEKQCESLGKSAYFLERLSNRNPFKRFNGFEYNARSNKGRSNRISRWINDRHIHNVKDVKDEMAISSEAAVNISHDRMQQLEAMAAKASIKALNLERAMPLPSVSEPKKVTFALAEKLSTESGPSTSVSGTDSEAKTVLEPSQVRTPRSTNRRQPSSRKGVANNRYSLLGRNKESNDAGFAVRPAPVSPRASR